MIVKCNWKTCRNNKNRICNAEIIELKDFDYEEDEKELEGLKCSSYEYDSCWTCKKDVINKWI